MEEGYRVPTIDEFVEGFEYEDAHDMRWDIVDFTEPANTIKGEWQRIWHKKTVPNLDPISYPYTIKNEDGTTWTFMNSPGIYDEDPLSYIKVRLEQGLIRTKK